MTPLKPIFDIIVNTIAINSVHSMLPPTYFIKPIFVHILYRIAQQGFDFDFDLGVGVSDAGVGV